MLKTVSRMKNIWILQCRIAYLCSKRWLKILLLCNSNGGNRFASGVAVLILYLMLCDFGCIVFRNWGLRVLMEFDYGSWNVLVGWLDGVHKLDCTVESVRMLWYCIILHFLHNSWTRVCVAELWEEVILHEVVVAIVIIRHLWLASDGWYWSN
jgi:hypothetical protein